MDALKPAVRWLRSWDEEYVLYFFVADVRAKLSTATSSRSAPAPPSGRAPSRSISRGRPSLLTRSAGSLSRRQVDPSWAAAEASLAPVGGAGTRRRATPPRMGRCNCRRWGDVIVAQHVGARRSSADRPMPENVGESAGLLLTPLAFSGSIQERLAERTGPPQPREVFNHLASLQ